MKLTESESKLVARISWLRAAVLGANDGILSTASLVVGVATGVDSSQAVLIAGVAGMVGGALSMAAGEYVSVSSLADAEAANRARDEQERLARPEGEAQDIGLTEQVVARPIQAALSSAISFSLGASVPLAMVLLFQGTALPVAVTAASLVFLALLGALGAWMGGAPVLRAVLRVTFWGAFAMAATAAIGSLFGTTVA